MIGEAAEAAFKRLFDVIYKGNVEATRLSFALLRYVHLWDDLVDQDKAIAPMYASQVMLEGLTIIAGSPLWGPDMQAHALQAYYRWYSANTLEAAPDEEQWAKAWMLRASVYDLFIVIAGRVHGVTWAESIAADVHRFYGEQLEEFIKEVKSCQNQQPQQ